jgi:hypothetical protein
VSTFVLRVLNGKQGKIPAPGRGYGVATQVNSQFRKLRSTRKKNVETKKSGSRSR